MRVNMLIPDELLKQIDEKAKSMHINRTAWVVMTLSKQLQQDYLMDNLPELIEKMNNLESMQDEFKKFRKIGALNSCKCDDSQG